MTGGPIIIVDDDQDDREIYAEVLKNIGITNPVHFFVNGKEFLDYLYTTPEQPFVILSDVNMPVMTGLQLKQTIQDVEYLRTKGIPFIFISTNASTDAVRLAHLLSVQGYFKKPSSLRDIEDMFRTIFRYWERCRHINNT